MPALDNVTVARTFHEAWAEFNPVKGAVVIADDCIFVDVPRNEIQHGPEGYREDYERWRAAFADGTVEITRIIAEDDWVVVEFTNSGRIFGKISQVGAKYDGFIEKYIGDAVMALFGVSKSQEDDPVRAIKAPREIHELVATLSPECRSRIGQSLTMHTGINTGLVVTGEIDSERGTHGVAGDTINLSAPN